MLRMLIAGTLAAGLAGCGASRTFSEADREAIMEQRAGFVEAINLGDWSLAAGVYHEDAMVQPPNGPRLSGKLAVKEFFETMPPIGQFTMYGEEVTPAGSYAVVTGRYAMVVLPPGTSVAVPDTGKFVEIWTREGSVGGGWRLIHDTWNSDLPMPAPPPGN